MTRHPFRWPTYEPRLSIFGYGQWAQGWTAGRTRSRPLCAICRLDMHAVWHRRVR